MAAGKEYTCFDEDSSGTKSSASKSYPFNVNKVEAVLLPLPDSPIKMRALLFLCTADACNTAIQLESILLSSTEDFSGTIVRLTAGVANIVAGDALVLSTVTAGRVLKARANVSDILTPCMGIAVTSQANIGSSVDVLLTGIVNSASFPFTSSDIGKPVFVSASSGDLTTTAPSVANQKVQVVGIVIKVSFTVKQMLFNPSYNIIKL